MSAWILHNPSLTFEAFLSCLFAVSFEDLTPSSGRDVDMQLCETVGKKRRGYCLLYVMTMRVNVMWSENLLANQQLFSNWLSSCSTFTKNSILYWCVQLFFFFFRSVCLQKLPELQYKSAGWGIISGRSHRAAGRHSYPPIHGSTARRPELLPRWPHHGNH